MKPRLLVLGDIFENAAIALYGESWPEHMVKLAQGRGVTEEQIRTWPRKGAPGWAFELLRPILVDRKSRIDEILKAVPVIENPAAH